MHFHLFSLPHHLLLLKSYGLCLYFFCLGLKLVLLFDRLFLLLFLDHLYHLAHHTHLVLLCLFKLLFFFMLHLFAFLYEFTEDLVHLVFYYDAEFCLNLLVDELVDLGLGWLWILRLKLDCLVLILYIIILVGIILHHFFLFLIGLILFFLLFFHLYLIILDGFYERSRPYKRRIWHIKLSSMIHLLHLYSLLWNGKQSL